MIFFSCVEEQDEANPEETVERAKASIIKRIDQVNMKDLMIYSYAHLAPALSSPDVAIRILKGPESSLVESGYKQQPPSPGSSPNLPAGQLRPYL